MCGHEEMLPGITFLIFHVTIGLIGAEQIHITFRYYYNPDGIACSQNSKLTCTAENGVRHCCPQIIVTNFPKCQPYAVLQRGFCNSDCNTSNKTLVKSVYINGSVTVPIKSFNTSLAVLVCGCKSQTLANGPDAYNCWNISDLSYGSLNLSLLNKGGHENSSLSLIVSSETRYSTLSSSIFDIIMNKSGGITAVYPYQDGSTSRYTKIKTKVSESQPFMTGIIITSILGCLSILIPIFVFFSLQRYRNRQKRRSLRIIVREASKPDKVDELQAD